ncbi:MAG: hypothetical protein K2M42_03885 [Oscillospiraceae bacterium]|nr:hypothetical protein [Oscillospiraceae bacterium]
MRAIFGNGAEVTYLDAIETEEFWGGSSRRTLTFTCAADAVSIDALNAILSDTANTETLALQGAVVTPEGKEQAVTNLYEGYTMKLSVGIDSVLVQPESPDSAAVYADRLVFKLGRPTFIEQQLAKLGLGTEAQA